MRSGIPGPTAPALLETEWNAEPKAECGCWHRAPTPIVTASEQEDPPLSVLHTSGAPL